MNTGVKRYSLSKQISDELEEKITSGIYMVGQKIPPEKELMEIFNVSRNTLREAVKSLVSAGMLEVRQGDGTYVCSDSRFNANMSMVYSQVSMSDIRETRYYVEIAIVHFAALRRTEADMERIFDAYSNRCLLSGEASRENTMADIKFHMVIAQACHNKIFTDIYKSIYSYLKDHIAKRQAQLGTHEDEIEELHKGLYLAIRDQDPESAELCAKRILEI